MIYERGSVSRGAGKPFDLDEIHTARLRGERLRRDHLDELSSLLRDTKVMLHLGGIRTADQVRQRLESGLDHWEKHGFGIWMLRDRQDGGFVGRAGLRYSKRLERDEPELLYTLRPEYWGRGYATEIAKHLLQVARNTLGSGSVIAVTNVGNRGSRRVLEKVGFNEAADQQSIASGQVLYRVEFLPARYCSLRT